MNYQEKVKKSKNILKKIKNLKDKEELIVTYGKDFKDNPREFKISANQWTKNMSYSIYENKVFGSGMNVDKITGTQLKCYTYDMMANKTTYNFPLYMFKLRNVHN